MKNQYEAVDGKLIENYQVKPVVAPKHKSKRRSIGMYHIVMGLTIAFALLITLFSH